MLAQSLKVYLDKIGIHYSWVMAAMVFLFTLATSSIGNAPQILILPITEAHGWNISDVSLATGLMYLMTALLCPIGAPLMLRIGVINVVLIVIFLEILGLLCTVLAYEKWHLLFSIGLCLGIASGIIGLAAEVATRRSRRNLVVRYTRARRRTKARRSRPGSSSTAVAECYPAREAARPGRSRR